MFHVAGPGRPKGSPNKTTAAVREVARQIVDDPEYRIALKLRVALGEAPGMEQLLWHYAYGKPKETVELEGHLDLVAAVRSIIIDPTDASK